MACPPRIGFQSTGIPPGSSLPSALRSCCGTRACILISWMLCWKVSERNKDRTQDLAVTETGREPWTVHIPCVLYPCMYTASSSDMQSPRFTHTAHTSQGSRSRESFCSAKEKEGILISHWLKTNQILRDHNKSKMRVNSAPFLNPIISIVTATILWWEYDLTIII